jgi:hypothetical protein
MFSGGIGRHAYLSRSPLARAFIKLNMAPTIQPRPMNTEETPAVEINNTDSQPSESPESESMAVETIDEDALYQNELDRIRKEKEEKARKKAAYTVRQEAKADDDDEYDEDRPLTRADLLSFKDDIIGTVSATTKQSQYEQRIQEVSTGKEAELIREILESGTVSRTGNIDEDVANARAIANKHRLSKILSEVQRSQASNVNASSNVIGTQETASTREPAMTPEEALLSQKVAQWKKTNS